MLILHMHEILVMGAWSANRWFSLGFFVAFDGRHFICKNIIFLISFFPAELMAWWRCRILQSIQAKIKCNFVGPVQYCHGYFNTHTNIPLTHQHTITHTLHTPTTKQCVYVIRLATGESSIKCLMLSGQPAKLSLCETHRAGSANSEFIQFITIQLCL